MWAYIVTPVGALVMAVLFFVMWNYGRSLRTEMLECREEMHRTRSTMEALFRERVAAAARAQTDPTPTTATQQVEDAQVDEGEQVNDAQQVNDDATAPKGEQDVDVDAA